MNNNIKYLTVKHCSSCGKDHERVELLWMKDRVHIDHQTFRYRYTCPETDKPVYVLFNYGGQAESAEKVDQPEQPTEIPAQEEKAEE